MTATSGSKSGRGGRRPGAGRKRKDPAKPPKVPKQRGGSGRGGWRPGAGRKPGPWSAGPSRPPPNQAELFAEAFTSEPPIAASAKGPALGAYSASATEAATPGTNAPTGERERPIEFLLRISNLLEPRDGNAIREIVDRLEAGTSFEQAIGLASDWRSRERNRMLRALASRGFSAGRIAKGLREGERGEFPAFAERIIRLDNGRTRCARQILNF